jgi:hypothetical protein
MAIGTGERSSSAWTAAEGPEKVECPLFSLRTIGATARRTAQTMTGTNTVASTDTPNTKATSRLTPPRTVAMIEPTTARSMKNGTTTNSTTIGFSRSSIGRHDSGLWGLVERGRPSRFGGRLPSALCLTGRSSIAEASLAASILTDAGAGGITLRAGAIGGGATGRHTLSQPGQMASDSDAALRTIRPHSGQVNTSPFIFAISRVPEEGVEPSHPCGYWILNPQKATCGRAAIELESRLTCDETSA